MVPMPCSWVWRHAVVRVGVLVHEVDRSEQCVVGEDLVGRARRRRSGDPRRTRRTGRRAGRGARGRAWRPRSSCRPGSARRSAPSATAACGDRARRSARRTATPRGSSRAPTRSRPASSARPRAGTAPDRRGRRCRASRACRRRAARPRRVGMPMLSGPNAISSRTVGENTCASEFWKTKPTLERKPALNCSSSRRSSVTGSPKAEYVPVSANSSPSRILSSVDFPQPLAPSSATFSPRATASETPSSAAKRPR